MKTLIPNLYRILFFTVPLILWPFTSELFEFNKMIVVYVITIIIVAAWLYKSLKANKFIFRRTILDIPLLIFTGSQLISTVVSIDPQTSLMGYYSRFNGGLLSIICYSILYWAFVSNIQKNDIKKLINSILISAILVSVYGVLERLGIDKNIWQQDVQNRVFSTLGQPNWLAAWLVALIPIVWVSIIKLNNEKLSLKSIFPYLQLTLFFTTLLFTGSRSGLLGFLTASAVFWSLVVITTKFKFIKSFLIINSLTIFIALIFGTQLTPSIFKIIEKNKEIKIAPAAEAVGTSLETGGTESGTIRKIVWQGAVDIWKHYPIFGTGVETFAYSYFLYRPVAHNVTSEWDFIYNKAHNEYLNYLANTGTVGIVAYLILIGFSIYQIINHRSQNLGLENISDLRFALLAGYVSILVTNFFGFSVVPIQILFFLYPAIAVALTISDMEVKTQNTKSLPANTEKIAVTAIFLFASYFLIKIFRYWYADTLYVKGLNYNRANRQDISLQYLTKAIKLQPKQSLFYAEESKTLAGLSLAYDQAKDATTASELSLAAIDSINKAVGLSPANLNHKRTEFSIYIILSSINPTYQEKAKNVLLEAIKQAPTDAKLHYNLGLIYSRLDEKIPAMEALKKAVELKSNYIEARLAYAIMLIDSSNKSEAKLQLEYILTKLDPKNTLAKQYLESIK